MMNFPVGIIKTTPQSVLSDYESLLRSCGFDRFADSKGDFLLAVDLGRDRFFPGASAPPWQMECVARIISGRIKDGQRMYAFFYSPRPFRASLEKFPKSYRGILTRYGIEEATEADHRSKYKGKNVIVLSALRTHLFHNVYGSMMSNAVFLNARAPVSPLFVSASEVCASYEHLKHSASNVFAVLDGTFAGDGDGPNCIRVFTKDIILAGNNPISLDAVAARIMGFDPSSVPYLREAGRRNLGCIVLEGIQKVGADMAALDFRFHNTEGGFFTRLYKFCKERFDFIQPPTERQKFLSKLLARSADVYTRFVWFDKCGKERLAKSMETRWGALLKDYESGVHPTFGGYFSATP